MQDLTKLTPEEQAALAEFRTQIQQRLGEAVPIPPAVMAIFRRQWAQIDAECHAELLEIRRRERYISPEVRNMRFY